MRWILIPALFALLCPGAQAEESEQTLGTPHLSQFGAGTGPTAREGVLHLLDDTGTKKQSNAAAFDTTGAGARSAWTLRGSLRVEEGGDGGSFLFLSTKHFGPKGPAPFLESVVEPNLEGSFAVGIDVHNPPSKEMFSPWGNYEDRPQREISLHWDGREIVKRMAPTEFRGTEQTFSIHVQHVIGGAEVTVVIAGSTVYDAYFVPKLHPYEMRVAVAAGTRADASTTFACKDLRWSVGAPAPPQRRPLHVEVFNHVLTNNQKTSYDATVDLPPASWAFGRVILTLKIHDAGPNWDEWDRNGEILVIDEDGTKHPIVPFITSYRTECHWTFDVTHFRPLLAGRRTLRIAAGTTFYKNRGYMMSVDLDFHHGVRERMPTAVIPLWVGRAKYGSDENHFQDFFEDKTVAIPDGTLQTKIFTTTTGHSQVGEFTPSRRTIIVQPGGAEDADLRFDNTLWKTDVYLNPNRPQFGTWQYARAGWAPGDMVWPWIIDLADALPAGAASRFRYLPAPYTFAPGQQAPSRKQIDEANHVVRSYLVCYGDGADLRPAPTVRIGSVAKKSNAEAAGIRVGDYLVSYDGRRIDGVEDLRAAIGAAKEKETVTVVLVRGIEDVEVEMKTGRMGISLRN